MVANHQGKGVPFAIRSRPVGYAAEYLTCGSFAAIPMGFPLLMSICCILYHFWDVRRILLPPPWQFRTPLATASRLGLQPRGICGLDRHRSFEFYRSSTSSSSTIVFIQRHRWVTHSTPTPCEKIIQSSILPKSITQSYWSQFVYLTVCSRPPIFDKLDVLTIDKNILSESN